MAEQATVTTQGDDEGEYIVFPTDFTLPFGPDTDIVLERVGDTLYIRRANDGDSSDTPT